VPYHSLASELFGSALPALSVRQSANNPSRPPLARTTTPQISPNFICDDGLPMILYCFFLALVPDRAGAIESFVSGYPHCPVSPPR